MTDASAFTAVTIALRVYHQVFPLQVSLRSFPMSSSCSHSSRLDHTTPRSCTFTFLLVLSVEPSPLINNVLRAPKNPSSLAITVLYTCFSPSVMSVDSRTASACSPRHYRRVLTCFAALSLARPDTTWNCSKTMLPSRSVIGIPNIKRSSGC